MRDSMNLDSLKAQNNHNSTETPQMLLYRERPVSHTPAPPPQINPEDPVYPTGLIILNRGN